MKQKKLGKKLHLNRLTVAHLDNLYGGSDETIQFTQYTCQRKTCGETACGATCVNEIPTCDNQTICWTNCAGGYPCG